MKFFCGTDIIEISRIKESIMEKNIQNLEENCFLKRVYTEKEISYCEGRKSAKYRHYAARFAAKEAVFKAISALLVDKFSINWKNIEIINDENGRPQVTFVNLNKNIEILNDIKNIDISLSHCKEYAVAMVVLHI